MVKHKEGDYAYYFKDEETHTKCIGQSFNTKFDNAAIVLRTDSFPGQVVKCAYYLQEVIDAFAGERNDNSI
jgi:hypothetical protein